MSPDYLEIVSRLTSIGSESGGARTHIQQVVETLVNALPARYGFVFIEVPETEKIEVLGVAGLDAVTFRRLEARASASALVRIFDLPEPMGLLVNDEPTLDFLVVPDATIELQAIPVMRGPTCIGAACIAFKKQKYAEKATFIRLMQIAATVINQILRMDRLATAEGERLAAENVSLKRELKEKYDFGNLIGNSGPMREVYVQVTQVARSNVTVLLRGEGGTGKELIAHAIHYNSLRSKRPFVKLNCGTLPENLIHVELFGSDERDTPGRIAQAEGGTLFLDEIGELSPHTQAMLLRILQDREFERVGGNETLRTNIRLVAATSSNLESSIEEGHFREDLFYRLNAFTIFLPPLRERRSDILLLADHFLEKYAAEHGKRIRRITTPAIDMLTAYHFPGNVRELENAIERAVIVCDTNVIHGHHLPPTLQTAEVSGTETRLNLTSAVGAFESDMIQDALKSACGNVAQAARMLDSTERILGYKIKKYGIDPSRFKKWSATNS